MGIIETLKGVIGLSDDVNKVKEDKDKVKEGVISDYLPELKLEMADDEILKRTKTWQRDWDKYATDLSKKQDKARKYWLGKLDDTKQVLTSFDDDTQKDNIIFEALETFLPIASRQNPEPLVTSDNTSEGIAISKNVAKMLMYQLDILRYKLKQKQVLRFWALDYVGVMKIGWSEKRNDIILKVLKCKDLILDPEAAIEDCIYQGEYIGEKKREKARTLIQRFPASKEFITKLALGELDTKIQYTEWWTDTMLFWTLKDQVLDKIKNPHWNYDFDKQMPKTVVDEYGEEVSETDEYGEEINETITIRGSNHFSSPIKPYVFLSVFNLMEHPHDDTSLIEQNIPQQDMINKRNEQIEKNVDDMNGGWVISLANSGLNKEQASLLAEVLRGGGAAVIPSGTPRNAIDRIMGSGLPNDVFNNLQDMRNELRGIFGTTGLTPQGAAKEQTVRGKIIIRGQDADRIGGGVAEYLEQFADQILNWMVQMFYVYYTEEHSGSIIGRDGAMEWITLKNANLDRKLIVSIKEGSMIPKDSITQRNEAVDLWTSGALDPVTLFERLEFPNPQETAQRLMAYKQGQLLQEQAAKATPPVEEPQAEGQPDILNNVPLT